MFVEVLMSSLCSSSGCCVRARCLLAAVIAEQWHKCARQALPRVCASYPQNHIPNLVLTSGRSTNTSTGLDFGKTRTMFSSTVGISAFKSIGS
eukprot:356223-Chlamydomonas_euryale.AAC.2